MSNSKMIFDYREWIAVDCEVAAEGYALLLGIQVAGTQEAWPLRNGLAVDGGSRADHAMRNVADENIEPLDVNGTRLRLR